MAGWVGLRGDPPLMLPAPPPPAPAPPAHAPAPPGPLPGYPVLPLLKLPALLAISHSAAEGLAPNGRKVWRGEDCMACDDEDVGWGSLRVLLQI